MRILFFAVLISCLTFSCQNDTKKEAKKTKPQNVSYPSLPKADMEQLYQSTISIDVIAYDLGVSMSYNEAGSIQPLLAFITPEPGDIAPACKSIGRISFMNSNGVGEEAEMYLHKGCRSFVWLKDGKKKYSNLLTHEGLEFLTQFMPENPKDLKMPADGKVQMKK